MEKLSLRQFAGIVALYAAGVLYILTDQFFVPADYRLRALVFVIAIIFMAIYSALKPQRPMRLAVTLTLIFAVFVIPLYLIQDLLINRNFTIKPLVITIASLCFPALIGFVYLVAKILTGHTKS